MAHKTPAEIAADNAAQRQSDADAEAQRKADAAHAQDEALKATQQPATTAFVPFAAPAPAPVAEDTITLHFVGSPYTGKLIVGVEEIAVDEGVVKVPSRLVAGARQAGFQ